jgi:hypothetical protein
MVIEPLAEGLLEDRFETGDTIYLGVESERMVFRGEDELKTR